MLVIVRDDVGDGRAPILHLDAPVGRKGNEGHGPVRVELVSAVLPVDGCLDARGISRVGLVAVLRLFEKARVGAAREQSAA